MRFWLGALFRRWAGLTALLHSDAWYAAAQFACCDVPALYLFNVPVHSGIDDPHRRVLFSPRIEVDIDGLWLLDDAAEWQRGPKLAPKSE
ncbi:hypothetical protein OG559_22760 [Micromonospora sp. NBC_01405]|uniref:hypothetical protein n=1 Tax=Micromonospora sp. NBC_01405 TaxID=2903589 RepID=UPI00324F412B